MAAPAPAKVDRQTTTPFLLRLFYRNNSFHRLEEFQPSARLPPHLQIYTWPTCTLSELTNLLLTALPSLINPPYAGIRIAFRMVYADLQTRLGAPARYISRELGSVVIGEEAEFGATDQSNDQDRDTARDGDTGMTGAGEGVNLKIALNNLTGEPSRTLSDAKFVIGDYICCAILTPLADGSVAPAPLPPARGPAGRGGRENGFGRGDYAFGRGMRSGRYDDGGRGGRFDDGGRGGRYDDGGRGGRYDDRRGNGGLPVGEWRRGEAPPSEGYWRGGGRGRGRGRW